MSACNIDNPATWSVEGLARVARKPLEEAVVKYDKNFQVRGKNRVELARLLMKLLNDGVIATDVGSVESGSEGSNYDLSFNFTTNSLNAPRESHSMGKFTFGRVGQSAGRNGKIFGAAGEASRPEKFIGSRYWTKSKNDFQNPPIDFVGMGDSCAEVSDSDEEREAPREAKRKRVAEKPGSNKKPKVPIVTQVEEDGSYVWDLVELETLARIAESDWKNTDLFRLAEDVRRSQEFVRKILNSIALVESNGGIPTQWAAHTLNLLEVADKRLGSVYQNLYVFSEEGATGAAVKAREEHFPGLKGMLKAAREAKMGRDEAVKRSPKFVGVAGRSYHCWRCNAPDHALRDCPVPADPANPFPFRNRKAGKGGKSVEEEMKSV
jgi:hypothetical protein